MEISETFSPFNSLPQFASLLQLKIRAKELQKSYDSGDDRARGLVRFHLPKQASAQTLKLAHAQFVIARSYGFNLTHRTTAKAGKATRSIAMVRPNSQVGQVLPPIYPSSRTSFRRRWPSIYA